MKKFYLLFFLTLLPSVVNADPVEIDGIYYNLVKKTKTAEVTRNPSFDRFSSCYSGDIVIPKKVTNKGVSYNVTSIGEEAFMYCKAMTSVSIPNSVTSIGNSAFYYCSGLTSIDIPNGVTSIGNGVLQYCSGLTSVSIPNSVTSIGDHAFHACNGLTTLEIPNSVTSIDGWAFAYCKSLPSVEIPNSVISMGYSAFSGCTGLTSVTISNSLTTISESAFYGCSGLTSVTIPIGVTSIGGSAFSGCSGLTSVTIPNSVTSIGYGAFSNCKSLPSVKIPTSVTSIGASAFSFCKSLTSVKIPASVISIGESTFNGCCGLTSVTIPTSVTLIDNQAFRNCSNLGSIKIPNSVTSISDRTFEGCSCLTNVVIPTSVTSIGKEAFKNCSQLASIDLPNSVASIGIDAFLGTPFYDNQSEGILYVGKVLYKYVGTMPDGTKIKIKDGTLGVAGGAFDGCSGLTSVTFPSSLTSIGDKAFRKCSKLSSIKIPNNVTSISASAFQDCSALTSLTIPNSVTSIGGSAFSGCSALTSLTIPASVTSIGLLAFSFCSGLSSIIVEDGNTVYYSRNNAIIETVSNSLIAGCQNTTIPNDVTSIDGAFAGCTGLTSITIPASVTSIRGGAFRGCSGLTSISIPSSVSLIDLLSFAGCTSLVSVTIGSGLTEISSYSFAGCSNVTDVYCYAESVPAIRRHRLDWEENEYYLFGQRMNNTTLHVPAGSVDAYIANSKWKDNFKEIVGFTGSVKLNKSKATVEKGKTMTLKATITLPEKSVTWKSSNTKVATVTSKGKVTGVKAGTATITCTSTVSGAKATCKVTVGYVKLDQTEVTVKKGKTVTLTPTVYPSSLTDKSVTWTSSDTNVATVTSAGKVKGVKTGTATITCTSVATGLSTTCEVIVGNVVLNKYTANLKKGKTVTLKATVYPTSLEDRSVTWKSSDSKIASVTSAGKVKGIGYGTATITCTSVVTGLSRTCQVTVGDVVLDKSEATVKKGKTVTLTATVYPSTLEDKSVTWESSDKSIATVTSAGKVKGIKAGTATITCTSVATGLSGTCTVTVTATSGSRSVDGDDDDTTGTENLEETPALAEPYDVYDLSGRKVRHQVNSLDGLPDGVYIVNGKKILKKK